MHAAYLASRARHAVSVYISDRPFEYSNLTFYLVSTPFRFDKFSVPFFRIIYELHLSLIHNFEQLNISVNYIEKRGTDRRKIFLC